ncbi:MAG: transcriptional regulator with XRE-family HTH domain [Flammeovirgaceae bacterium]|jgi:transcriptional regulator with XRE-family HTH domain
MIHLGKNLRYLREKNGKISQGKLAEALGITRSAVSSYEDGRAEPKLMVLTAMADFFNVTVDQLLNLELVKMEDEAIAHRMEVQKYASASNLRILSITVDDEGKENVEFVPEKAAAGYTTGYADEEYLSDLQKYKLPFLPNGKTYRAFEITGDSMLPILPNTIVIGEYIDDFNGVKEGRICIVVTKDGVVLKKVYKKIKERNTLCLKSSNIIYEPYEVPVEEVSEIWGFAAYISRQVPEESANQGDLRGAFDRLEAKVMEIESKMN